jgi:hypothetical protein
MASFKRILANASFLRSIVQAKNNPRKLVRIIKQASSSNLLALVEILKNLKRIPLLQAEKYQFCQRREAIKQFIKKNTKCAVRKSICLKRTLQTGSGKNQVGGIFPILPIIAGIGTLLASLSRKDT